jgi:hypothetical protein
MANDPYLNGGTVFSDAFSGGLRKWDFTRSAAIDRRAAPGTDSGAPVLKLASGAVARADLVPRLPAVCVETAFKVNALDGKLTLIRFQNSPDETFGRVFVNAKRQLWVESDRTGKRQKVGVRIQRAEWYDLEVCLERGHGGSWTIAVDGDTKLQWDTRNLGKKIRSFRLGHGADGDAVLRYDDVTAWVPN